MKATYKRYELSPEAELRRIERNRKQNERLKEERRLARIAAGKPESSTPEYRKEQMRLYMRDRRAKERVADAGLIEAKRLEKQQFAREKKNAYERGRREAARLAGRPDLRTKQYRPVPKPKVPRSVPTLKKGRNIVPKKQLKQMVTRKEDLSTLTRVRIDHKTEIFIKPGTDPEAAKRRYLDRKMKF